jgi:uncharacterized membrane protein
MGQMTAWARGVAINGAITGVSIGALLWLIGVQPALIFGVFAFLGEFLPTVGAFLVSIPILLVALSMGATKFWLALVVIVLVYQIELNVLVPGVLGKEMRLHPVNILFFTLATATMFGLLGVFLAVPAAALVHIVIDEFYLRPRKPDYAALDREAAALVEAKSNLPRSTGCQPVHLGSLPRCIERLHGRIAIRRLPASCRQLTGRRSVLPKRAIRRLIIPK